VRRLMREQDLVAIQPKRFKPRTTDSDHNKLISPNLLRDVNPPLTWGEQIVGDITYLPLIDGGFGYMATFQDRKTKRVVGRTVAASLEAKGLVVKALQMALRQGLIKRGAIIHTDRGSQYVSKEYRDLLERCGLRQSCRERATATTTPRPRASSRGSRPSSSRRTPSSQFERSEIDLAHAKQEAFSYIEGYYNRIRSHSSIDNMSPMEFETELKTKAGRRNMQDFCVTF
jgi:putative transposase